MEIRVCMTRYLPSLLLLVCFTLASPPGRTQASGAVPVKIGEVTISGSLRTRVESWNWFEGSANNDYTYPGSILRLSLSESRPAFDWQLEFAAPFLLGLPNDAIA